MTAVAAITEEDRRQAWLAERRLHITGTDLAPIMDLPGAYGSKMGVYLDKKGLLERDEAPEWMKWGSLLQQPILVAWSEHAGVGVEFVDPYALFVSREEPILGASLDGRAIAAPRWCVDAKNVGFRDGEEWGEDGTDEIPARYVVQLHAQMDVTDTPRADLAVLFGGRQAAFFTVHRDEEIIAAIRDAARGFWLGHVVTDRPPPVDGSDEWTRFLAARAERFKDYVEVATLPEDKQRALLVDLAALRDAKKAAKDAKAAEALHGNRVRFAIGEHAGLVLPDGKKCHFKRNKDGEAFDAEAYLARVEAWFLEQNPDARGLLAAERKKLTTTKPGNRPLLLPKVKGEEETA